MNENPRVPTATFTFTDSKSIGFQVSFENMSPRQMLLIRDYLTLVGEELARQEFLASLAKNITVPLYIPTNDLKG